MLPATFCYLTSLLIQTLQCNGSFSEIKQFPQHCSKPCAAPSISFANSTVGTHASVLVEDDEDRREKRDAVLLLLAPNFCSGQSIRLSSWVSSKFYENDHDPLSVGLQ